MTDNQQPASTSDDSDREQRLIETIMKGDAAGLAKILDAADDQQELLTHRIGNSRPTNHVIGHGATLLQFASYRPERSGDAVLVLLDRGAEIDIHSACGLGRTDRIEEILSTRPDAVTDQVDTYFPIQYAITAKQPDSVDCLLNHGDDPNRDLKKMAYFGWEDELVDTDYSPWKPIHMASLYGFDASRIPVVETLVKHGADLNCVSPLDGYRPIHLVAMPNRVDMIRFFASQGVDVNSRTEQCKVFPLSSENESSVSGFECTPLMVTCGEGFVEAAERLIELGADVNARNSEGKSALDFASKRFWNGQPYDQVIKVLTDHGAK